MAEATKKKSAKTDEPAAESKDKKTLKPEKEQISIGEMSRDESRIVKSEVSADDTPKAAKAGKRSEKSLKEAEAKKAKQERKAKTAEAISAPKPPQKPARSILERKGKNFRKAAEQLEAGKQYNLNQATELAVKTSPVKFDATVELHIRLAVDPRQADQNIRDMVTLPAGTGKTLRVAVLADPDGITAAKKAGADMASGDEFLQNLDKGIINFDLLISTPAFMPKLGKYARLLGPKGLMPNPKSGTVTADVAKAVTEAKAGRVEYRIDSTGIVHVGVGKVSFGGDKLLQNVRAVLDSIKQNKPASIRGNYVRSLYLATSMGPSIAVATSEF